MQIKDLIQDKRNYRKHNKKNLDLIKKSVKEVGLGRSVVIDNENEIVCGNGLVSTLDKNTPIKVIETDGTELVVVKRTDLNTNDEKRKQLEKRREISRRSYHKNKTLKGRTVKKVVCGICKKEFETNTNKRYCSDECKRQARLNTIKKYDNSHKEEKRKYWEKYVLEHKEQVIERRHNYYISVGKAKLDKRRKENSETINARIKKWREENPEKSKAIKEKYKQNNIEKIRENARKNKAKYNKNPLLKLKFNISRAFNRYFTKEMTTKEYMKYFGYTVEELKNHLEQRFKPDMNWQNYGTLWHIDHIKPQSWFDFNDITQIKECWSLKNLQPLYATVNLSKGNRYEG